MLAILVLTPEQGKAKEQENFFHQELAVAAGAQLHQLGLEKRNGLIVG